MSSQDPEIRDLAVATARAYAIAERLAEDLNDVVTDLSDYIRERPQYTGPERRKRERT